ncbi:MAG: hypothetical protein WC869_08195 [Phycisphaerae bacterium]|jgi:hypothetical protein
MSIIVTGSYPTHLNRNHRAQCFQEQSETLTGHVQATHENPTTGEVQFNARNITLNGGLADRNVKLPASTTRTYGEELFITNGGTTNALSIQTPGAVVLRSLAPGETGMFCNLGATLGWTYRAFGVLPGLAGPIADTGNWFTVDTTQGVADAIAAAIGGTSQGVRDYSTPLVLTNNQTLYASLLALDAWMKSLRLTLPAPTDVTVTGGGDFAMTTAVHAIRGAGGLADDLVTFSGANWRDGETRHAVCGAEAITVKDNGTTTATVRNADMVLAAGDRISVTKRGTVYYVEAGFTQAGIPEALLKPLTTAELLDFIPANQITTAVLQQAINAGAFTNAERTKFANDFVNEALLDSLVQIIRANLAMNETTPPVAGSGMVAGVGTELLVEAQAAPDLTIRIQTAGRSINHKGVANEVDAVVSLGGFTIPAGAGEQRKDMVIVTSTGTVARRVGVEGAAPSAEPILTDGDVPLSRVTLTQGADTTIAAGNITDVRNRRPIVASKIGAATTTDLLVLLATDQITTAVLAQAVNTGAITPAVAADIIAALAVSDAKLAQDRGKTAARWIGFTGGSTDITGGAATRDFKVNDGTGDVNCTIDKTGLDTGAKIAAAMQVQVRAIATGGYTLAEVRYDVGTGRYIVVSGTRGSASAMALAAGTTDDLCVSLKLLAADNAQQSPGCDNLDHALAQLSGLLAPTEIADVGALYKAILLTGMLQELRTTGYTKPAIDTTIITGGAGNAVFSQMLHTLRGETDPDNFDEITAADQNFGFFQIGAEVINIRDRSVSTTGHIHTSKQQTLSGQPGDLFMWFKADGTYFTVIPFQMGAGIPTGKAIGFTETWSIPVFGTWGIDSDGVYGHGAGCAGRVDGDMAKSQMGAGSAMVFDAGTGEYQALETSVPASWRTVDWQAVADVPANGDMFIMIFGTKPFELAYDLSVMAGTTGAAFEWLESQAGNTWGAHAPVYDGTDLTAGTGTRAFDQDGAQSWADALTWVSGTYGGKTGYGLALRIVDATKLATLPTFNGKRPETVKPVFCFTALKTGTILSLRLEDGASVLHTTADVHFRMVNYTKGTESTGVVFPMDTRTVESTGWSFAVSNGDKLWFIVDQEDGAAEVTNALVQLNVSITNDDHTHTL